MKKFLDKCSRRSSSSGSSTSQRQSSQSPEQQCWRTSSLASPRQLKNYKAFGKIYKAACQGDVTAVQLCLERGKKGVNDRDRNDRTLLHYACAYGHPDIVTLLISWNCDLNLRDSDNSTALIKASQYKQEECATILLKHGADVNATDKNRNTALHYAVWFNNTSMTANLLVHNADITIRNEDNFTPVIVALLKNNECVSQFLDKKAQVPPEADELGSDSSRSDHSSSNHSSKDENTSQESSAKLQTDTSSTEEEVEDRLQRPKCENLKPRVKRKHQTEESEQPQTIFGGTRWEGLNPVITALIRYNNQNLKRILAEETQTPKEADELGSRSDHCSSNHSSKDENTAQESSPKSRTDAPSREEDMRNRLERLEHRFQKLKDKRQHQLEELEQPQMTLDGTSGAQTFSSQSQTDAASREEDMLEQLERLKRDFLQLKVKIECQTEELEHPQMTLDGTSGAQMFSSQSRKDAASREEDMLEQLERLERRCQKLKVERQRQIEELGQPQMTLDGTSGAQTFNSQSRKDAASREEDMLEQLERLNRDFLQLKVKIKCPIEELEKPHVTLDGTSGAQEFRSQSRKDTASSEEDMLEQLESSKYDFLQPKVKTGCRTEELEHPHMNSGGKSWAQEFRSQSRKDTASSEEDMLEQLESSKYDFLQPKVKTGRRTEELEHPHMNSGGKSWAQEFRSQSRKDTASSEEDMLEQLESSKYDFLQPKVKTGRRTEELEHPHMNSGGKSWAQEFRSQSRKDTASSEEDMLEQLESSKYDFLQPKVKTGRRTEELEHPHMNSGGKSWMFSSQSRKDAASREEEILEQLESSKHDFVQLKGTTKCETEELEQPEMTLGGTSWTFSSKSRKDASSREEDMLEQQESSKHDFVQLKVKTECRTEELEQPQMTLDGTSWTFSSKSRKDAASSEEDMLEQLESSKCDFVKLKGTTECQTEDLEQPQMTLDGKTWTFSSKSRKDASSREEDMLEQQESSKHDFVQLKVKTECRTEELEQPQMTLDGTSWTFSSKSRKDAASSEEDMLEQLESSKCDFVKLKGTTECQTEDLEQPQMTLDGKTWTFSSKSRKDASSREEDMLEQQESSKHDFVQLKVKTECRTEELEQPQMTLDGTSWTFSSKSRKDAASSEEDMLEQLESSKCDFVKLKGTTECQTEDLEQPQMTLDGKTWAQTFSSQSRKDASSREEEILEQLESWKRDFVQLKITTECKSEELEQPQMSLDGTSWTFSSQSRKDAASGEEDMPEKLESSKRDFVQRKGPTECQIEELEQPQMTLDGKTWAQTFSSQSRKDAASREEDMLEQLESSKRDFLQLKVTTERQTEELEQPQMTLDGTSWTFSSQSRNDATRREEDILDQLESSKRDFLQLKVTTECQTEELEQPQMTLDGTSWAQMFSSQSRKDTASREEDMLEQLESSKRDFLQLKVTTECETEELEQPQMTLGGTSWAQTFRSQSQVDAASREEDMLEQQERSKRDFLQLKVTKECQTEELEQPQMTLDGTSGAQKFRTQSRTDAASREEDMLEQLERSKHDFLQLKVTKECQTEELKQPQMTLGGTSWTLSSQSRKDAASREEDMLEQLERLKRDFLQLKVKTECQIEELKQPQMTLGSTSWAQEFRSQSRKGAASREEDMLERLERLKRDFLQLKVNKECQTEDLEQPQMTLDGTCGVNKEVNHIFDSNEAMLPYQRKSVDCEIFSFDTIIDLVDQLKRQSKDPDILLIIWYAIHSYKRSMELQNYKFELISEKNKKIKDQVNLLKKDLKVAKEAKLDLELLKTKLQGELSNIRLEQENSSLRNKVRQNTGKDEELLKDSSEKDEKQLKKYTKENQSLKNRLEKEWKKNKEYVKELARVKNIFKMRQKNLNEEENTKSTCPEDLNTNQSETEEINVLRHKIDLATEKLNQVLFHCEQLKNENQLLHQKAEAMTAIQEKHKMLEDRREMLNQEFLSIETHMQKNMIERREAETLKQEIEEQSRLQLMEVLDGISRFSKTQSQAHEKAEQEKENSFALKLSDMECRVKDLESKLCRAQVQEDSVRFKLEVYQQCYLDQLKVTTALTKQINASKNQEQVEEDSTSTRLTSEEELITHPYTRGVYIPEKTGVSHHRHSVEFNGTFTPSLGTSSHQQRVKARQPKLPRFL
ncbi:ankyrin repeat domain-containing protein 26-like isoform X8 [Rattus norvegicus]|uniref:ankyrin repeat domain-containing protein 26-like isoform X8 n=1 Tax=Rattus norvegicus TaxID=10116 RepID=UPI002FD84269